MGQALVGVMVIGFASQLVGGSHKVVPPSYKWVITPLHIIDISPINTIVIGLMNQLS